MGDIKISYFAWCLAFSFTTQPFFSFLKFKPQQHWRSRPDEFSCCPAGNAEPEENQVSPFALFAAISVMATVGGDACIRSPLPPSFIQCSIFQFSMSLKTWYKVYQTNGRCSLCCPPMYSWDWQWLFLPVQRLSESEVYSHVLVESPPDTAVGICHPSLAVWMERSLAQLCPGKWICKLVGNHTSLRSTQHLSSGYVGFPAWWAPVLLHCFLLLVYIEVKLRICQNEDTVSRQGSLWEIWIQTGPSLREQKLEHAGCLLGSALEYAS